MGRTAIVTGASRGIGYAVALALAEEGFDIGAVALPDAERMAELGSRVTALGRRFAPYALDLGNVPGHGPVLEAVSRDLGTVECLVNNAGVSVRRRGDLLRRQHVRRAHLGRLAADMPARLERRIIARRAARELVPGASLSSRAG